MYSEKWKNLLYFEARIGSAVAVDDDEKILGPVPAVANDVRKYHGQVVAENRDVAAENCVAGENCVDAVAEDCVGVVAENYDADVPPPPQHKHS